MENEKEKAKVRPSYDPALKSVLQDLMELMLELAGYRLKGKIVQTELKDRELNQFLSQRADAVWSIWTENKGKTEQFIFHAEIQATDSGDIFIRMWIYFGLIWLKFGKMPKQILFYIGQTPLHWLWHIRRAFGFRYKVIELRKVPIAQLRQSRHPLAKLLLPFCDTPDPIAAGEETIDYIKSIENEEQREHYFSIFKQLIDLHKDTEFIKAMEHTLDIFLAPDKGGAFDLFLRTPTGKAYMAAFQAEIEAKVREAEKAKVEKAELEKTQAQAKVEKAELEKAQAELEKAQAELEKARAEKQLQVFRMFTKGLALTDIAEFTGLSIDEINRILGQ